MNKNNITRRDLLRAGGGAAAATALAGFVPACSHRSAEPAAAGSPGKKPRNIIFMVSDGMNMGVPAMAHELSRQARNGQATVWRELMSDPTTTHGYLRTESLTSMVTDSAAAAAEWGSGSMIANGMLNMLPDGTRLVPIAASCRSLGIRTGLVTTDKITGATPAGFAAIQNHRDNYESIALDYMEVVDLLMGGGLKHFDPQLRSDKKDLLSMYTARGYRLVTDRDTLLAGAGSGKVLGLFAKDTMPYTLDHQRDGELRRNTPTLEEMTRAALANLAKSSKGFLVQIEGARIDHACHANDAAAALWDQLAFDDAVRAALQFAQDDGQTLVIVTSDHATANPGLNGMGKSYNDSTTCFKRITAINTSFDRIFAQAKADAAQSSPRQAIAHAVGQATGLELSDEQSDILAAVLFDDQKPHEMNDQQRNAVGMLGQMLANHTGVSFTGTTHTNDHVLLSAWGPGAGAFAGIHHHIQIHRIVADYLGVTHVNPMAVSA